MTNQLVLFESHAHPCKPNTNQLGLMNSESPAQLISIHQLLILIEIIGFPQVM